MNKLRSKRITLTLCETLIYKPQNPKPSCAEIRSSLTRRPRQALQCARTGLTAHEVTSTGSPVRQNKPYYSRGDLDRPSRAQNKPSCSRDDLDRPSRAQNKPYCSRGDLDRPSSAPELALLLTRRPRQAIPCAEQAFLLTRRPRQAIQCAELAFLLTRRPRQALQCARTSLTAHEATSTDPPVRQKVTFAHETDEYDGRCAGRTLSRTENHSKGRQSIGR